MPVHRKQDSVSHKTVTKRMAVNFYNKLTIVNFDVEHGKNVPFYLIIEVDERLDDEIIS